MVDLANNRVLHGQQTVVTVADALSTINSTDSLADQVDSGTDYSAQVIDITITDPEQAVTLQNVFGGQIMVEEPADLVEIEFTMRFQDITSLLEQHPEASSAPTDFTRVEGSNQPGERPLKAVLFEFTHPRDSEKVNYLLNNALFIQFGEISQEADGYAEVSATVVGRIKDRYAEQDF